MAFPCRFVTALGSRVVTTARTPAPIRFPETEPGAQGGAARARPLRRQVTATRTSCRQQPAPHPDPPWAYRGGSRAAHTRPDKTLPHPTARQEAAPPNTGPARTLSHLLRAEPRRGPPPVPPCCRAPHSTGRGRKKEGPHPKAAVRSREKQRPRGQLCRRGTPRTCQRELLLLQPPLGHRATLPPLHKGAGS